MTVQARHFARLCRERMVAQGMTEEEADQACADEATTQPAAQAEPVADPLGVS